MVSKNVNSKEFLGRIVDASLIYLVTASASVINNALNKN